MFAHLPAPTADELKIAGYISDVQFMTDCWCRDFAYAEYAFHAARVSKHVHTAAEYQAHCESQEEQMAAYFVNPPTSTDGHWVDGIWVRCPLCK